MMKNTELFLLPRYKINIILLRILGQWPYQSKIENFFATMLWMLIVLSLLIPQIHRCVIEPTEDVIMSNITPLMTVAACVIKMLNNIYHMNHIRKMLRSMENEWANLKPGPDYDIMLKYADDGFKYTILYCLIFYNSTVVFVLLPMRPKVMVWLGLSEGPADFEFPYPVDYWIDSDKYFFFIESHVTIGSFFVMTSLVGLDALFLVFVQHVCAIFSVICNRLTNIPVEPLSKVNYYIDKSKDEAFFILSECIQNHSKAIEFSELLETTYSWSFFGGVGINTLLLTLTGFQIITHLDNIDEVIRFGPFFFGQVVHIFVESIISQQLMEHSGQIDQAIAMMKWYAISLRSQRLLNFMTMRSRVVCQITAGKIFTLSLEFFSIVMKTSMSYFTLLRSMRED